MSSNGNTVSYMKEYLKYAIEFEKYVYIWTQAMNEVNHRMRQIYNERKRIESVKQTTKESLSSLNSINDRKIQSKEKEIIRYRKKSNTTLIVILVVLVLLFFAGFIFGNLLIREPDTTFAVSKEIIPLILGLSTMTVLSLFTGFIPICIGLITSSKAKVKKLKLEISDLKNKYSMHRQEVILNNRQNEAENNWIENTIEESVLSERQDEIHTALQEAKNNLAQIYAKNILPPKYQCLNAVATLYEYLETGRCNTIQGHGGIYDTYENDLRTGIIIETLSDIKNSMYRIEANQQMLYREMQQANRTLANINSTLGEINKTTKEIEKNTAISAAANRQSAAALNWMAWNGVRVY